MFLKMSRPFHGRWLIVNVKLMTGSNPMKKKTNLVIEVHFFCCLEKVAPLKKTKMDENNRNLSIRFVTAGISIVAQALS
jgi:hypothetical protein